MKIELTEITIFQFLQGVYLNYLQASVELDKEHICGYLLLKHCKGPGGVKSKKLQLSTLKNEMELQLRARVQKGGEGAVEPQTQFANSVLHPSRKQSIKLVILILHFSHQKTVSVINVDSYCCNGRFTLVYQCSMCPVCLS